MMSHQLFNTLRKKFEKEQLPYKVVDRASIKYVGHIGESDTGENMQTGRNVLNVQGVNVLATDSVTNTLDRYSGFSREQREYIAEVSGDEGVRDFRNCLAAASSIANPSKIALIADPRNRTVINAIPVADEPICSESFFDFAEMFMDNNNLIPTRFEMGTDVSSGITLHMGSLCPEVRSFAKGEDTLVNSFFLKWNLGQIVLGRYFERLVCENGMTTVERSTQGRITSMDAGTAGRMLDIPKDTALLDLSYEEYSSNARSAINTRASLFELCYVSKMLERYHVSKEDIERIAPYGKEIDAYSSFGYDRKRGLNTREALAGMTVWDLFNGITHFASHTDGWDDNDNRRTLLQGDAMDFLKRPRDIRSYIDIHSGTGPSSSDCN